MAGNDKGPAFLLVFWDGDLDDAIQRIDDAIDAAARLHIKIWIARCVENVARTYHVRAPKIHDAIAVRVRTRRVDDFDTLVVEEEFLLS